MKPEHLSLQLHLLRSLMPTQSQKQKLCSNPRKQLSLPELNYRLEITTTVTRLRKKHFKGMKILPDGSRSYVECRLCSGTQLDPKHLFSSPFIVGALFKIDNDRSMDILY
ncbi:RNase H domain-containing protein [Trichonephila clavipes]|nr:RNase H domain-containing protein [Trichonephila clavipes]